MDFLLGLALGLLVGLISKALLIAGRIFWTTAPELRPFFWRLCGWSLLGENHWEWADRPLFFSGRHFFIHGTEVWQQRWSGRLWAADADLSGQFGPGGD